MKTTTPPRHALIAAGALAVVVLLAAGCSERSTGPRYELTVIFDEHTEPTPPPKRDRDVRVVGARPDGTLYIGSQVEEESEVLLVRSPDGSQQPVPAELSTERIEAMATDPVSGDAFVLTYPDGWARIRRLHDGRIVQDFMPRTPDGGLFPPQERANDDTVDLFYDSSSGSLLYADENLYRLDPMALSTVVVPRPKPPGEAHDGVDAGGRDDYAVAYAVESKRGTIYVAIVSPKSTNNCRIADAVYRWADGRLTHVSGGCVRGEDDLIEGGLFNVATDPVSGDLIGWGASGAMNWLSNGKTIEIRGLGGDPIRGVAFDGAGHAYVGTGGKIFKITFRR